MRRKIWRMKCRSCHTGSHPHPGDGSPPPGVVSLPGQRTVPRPTLSYAFSLLLFKRDHANRPMSSCFRIFAERRERRSTCYAVL